MVRTTAESLYTTSVQTPGGEVILFNPPDGNWDCLLLDQAMVDALESRFNGENGMADWDDLASNDRHSCDMVLDSDDDGLANFEEKPSNKPHCTRLRHGFD